MTIKDLIKNFTDTAKEKNITLYYTNEYGVDEDIFGWLPYATVSSDPVPSGNWKNVDTKNGTSEKTMLESAVKMPLAQAIQKFTEMLKNGEFDKLETYRIIFLTETKVEIPLKLYCSRRPDGKLYLNVDEVYYDSVLRDTGNAWFSSNENLEHVIELVTLDNSTPFGKAENIAIDFCDKWCDGKARAVIELRDMITNGMK